MGKKVVVSVGICLAILLVLSFALVLVVQYQAFFGTAITWVLIVCIGLLMLLNIYFNVSSIIGIVKHRNYDEEDLSEKHLEQMLSGSSSVVPKKGDNKKKAANEKKLAAQKLAQSKAIKKQTENEARLASEKTAKQKQQEEIKKRKLASSEAKAQTIATAEKEARERALTSGKEEKVIALAEADALKRASAEAEKKLAAEIVAHEKEQSVAKAKENAQQEAVLRRKAQAVENARKQAESMAAARRRAAQSAALSQTFTAIKSDQLPDFNTRIMNKMAAANVPAPVPPAHRSSASYKAHADDDTTESIWQKMKIRQSAAPILTSRGATSSFNTQDTYSGTQEMPDVQLTRTSPMPVNTAHPSNGMRTAVPSQTNTTQQTAQTAKPPASPEVARAATSAKPTPARTAATPPAKDAKGSAAWSYSPAKLPNAWKASDATKNIPGDMSFSGVPVDNSKLTTAKNPASNSAASAISASPLPPSKASTVASGEQPKRPRGRPPKPKTDEELSKPKRPRGRPPKPKTDEELNKPKRPRGRPPKPKTDEELNKPKRPRGRPRKETTTDDEI